MIEKIKAKFQFKLKLIFLIVCYFFCLSNDLKIGTK